MSDLGGVEVRGVETDRVSSPAVLLRDLQNRCTALLRIWEVHG